MTKDFSLFLALRYLKPKRTFVSIITLISVIGVVLGVAVLVVVMSVMSGFEDDFKRILLGFEPHVRVQQVTTYVPDPEDDFGDSAWRDVRDQLLKHPQVKTCSPFVDARVLIEFQSGLDGRTRPEGCIMLGVDEEDSNYISKLAKLVPDRQESGTFNIGLDDNGTHEAVISEALAATLGGVQVGESVKVISWKNYQPIFDAYEAAQTEKDNGKKVAAFKERIDTLAKDPAAFTTEAVYGVFQELEEDPELQNDFETFQSKIEELNLEQEVIVTGIFHSPQHAGFLFVSLATAQEIYNLGDGIHGLALTTDDAFKADQYKAEIENMLPPFWVAETWQERYAHWFEVVANERAMMFIVLVFIMIVAAFCIMNTMITVTVQKRREIGMLRALGGTVGQIIRLFLYKGIVVATLGTVGGFLVGMTVLHFRNDIRAFAKKFQVEIFSEQMYGLSEIPATIDPFDVGMICLISFILCALAALPPAWAVARLDPARALRNSS